MTAEHEHRRDDDFVSKEVCIEKEKTRTQQFCNVENEIREMRNIFNQLMTGFKEDKEVRRLNENKLFETTSEISRLLAESCKASESTQVELTEHKTNHWQLMSLGLAFLGLVVSYFEFFKGK